MLFQIPVSSFKVSNLYREKYVLKTLNFRVGKISTVTLRIDILVQVEPHSASIALRHASDLADSMKFMLTSFSSSVI